MAALATIVDAAGLVVKVDIAEVVMKESCDCVEQRDRDGWDLVESAKMWFDQLKQALARLCFGHMSMLTPSHAHI